MAVIVAAVTDDARKYWPQFFGGLMGVPGSSTTNPGSPPTTWDPRIKFFKVGVGGWVDPGSGPERRTPDASLRRLTSPLIQDIDAAVDPTRAVIDQRYSPLPAIPTFKKDLSVSDMQWISLSTLEIDCLLDFTDYNSDGSGNPEIWEIGIFGDHPEVGSLAADQGLMIAYGTFPKEVKDSTKQILNRVRIIF